MVAWGAVADSEVQRRLKELSAEPAGSRLDAVRDQLNAELLKREPIIRTVGLK